MNQVGAYDHKGFRQRARRFFQKPGSPARSGNLPGEEASHHALALICAACVRNFIHFNSCAEHAMAYRADGWKLPKLEASVGSRGMT